jgi:hypothetical protein
MTQRGTTDTAAIAERIIPLPKQLEVSGYCNVQPGETSIVAAFPWAPPLGKAVETLQKVFGVFRNGAGAAGAQAGFSIRLEQSRPGTASYQALSALPNADQAYRISPCHDGDKIFCGLTLSALSPAGIFYAAQTLSQAVHTAGVSLTIPELTVTDWPDISLRGQWGGTASYDLPNTAAYKLNAVDLGVQLTKRAGFSDINTMRGGLAARARFAQDDIASLADSLAVVITPFIPHIEQLTSRDGYPDFFDEATLAKVKNTPAPQDAAATDYHPSLCMSSENTGTLFLQWLEAILHDTGRTNIQVWLSEGPSPCMCEKCAGKEQFVLETAMLVRVFSRIREQRPDVSFEILLTQGSFPQNDKICAMVPDFVRLTYYDGGRTYTSDRKPMIYDVLTGYAQKSGKLGVYPQITHAWRVVFPWSGPDFIRYRCDEFSGKKLDKVIGYAVPANEYHRTNITAWAEWLWNKNGRDIDAFLRAWALKKGYDQEQYVRWNGLQREAAWDLAASRFILSMVFCYPIVLKKPETFADHRTELADFTFIENIDDRIEQSRAAAACAGAAGFTEEGLESLCILNALICCRSYEKLFGGKKSANIGDIQRAYEDLHQAALEVYHRILEWDNLCRAPQNTRPTRVVDTATVLLRLMDAGYDTLKAAAGAGNLRGAEAKYIYHKLGQWDISLFKDGPEQILRYDVTELVTEPGVYHGCFDFIKSASSTEIDSLRVYEELPDGSRALTAEAFPHKRLNNFEPWCELLFSVTAVRGGRRTLEIGLAGPETAATTCEGIAGIRGAMNR